MMPGNDEEDADVWAAGPAPRQPANHPPPEAAEPLAFWQHWGRRRVATDRAVLGLMLVMHVVSTLKNRHIFSNPGNLGFGLAYSAALAASLLWSGAALQSYAGWRDVPTTLIPLGGFYHPCTWEVACKALSDVGLWQQGPLLGAILFWVNLVFSTMLPFLMLLGLAWPRRCLWHWVVQGAFVALVLRQVGTICDSPLLLHPASQLQVGWAHKALRVCGTLFRVPAALLHVHAPMQCRGVLEVLVVMLGFVLPVVVTALWEWDEYRRFVSMQQRTRGERPRDLWWGAQERRGAVEEACRRVMLGILVLMLSVTVWDICLRSHMDGV